MKQPRKVGLWLDSFGGISLFRECKGRGPFAGVGGEFPFFLVGGKRDEHVKTGFQMGVACGLEPRLNHKRNNSCFEALF